MNIRDSYKLAISCLSFVLNISLNKNYKDKNQQKSKNILLSVWNLITLRKLSNSNASTMFVANKYSDIPPMTHYLEWDMLFFCVQNV